jgi:short-subunit dehydrogenase
MRMDLNPFGIRVGAIHPGMVQTEFSEVRFKGDTDRAEKVSRVHASTRRYADIIHFCIETVSYQHCRFSSNEYCTGFFYDYKKELEFYIATINCTVFT